MSKDLNQCNFIGRLGADPESRALPSGDAVCNFRIACGWKTKDKEGTEWVPAVAFGKLGEICERYLKKGSRVFISGSFRTRKWQGQDGQDRYSTEIIVSDMQMLDSKPAGDQSPAQGGYQQSAQGASPAPAKDFDDDIPF